MTDREKDKHLDELLDSALAHYSAAWPRPGLETRILAEMREAEATAAAAWHSWRWLWGGAIAAAAALLIVLLAGRHSQIPVQGNNVARGQQSPTQVTPHVQSTAPVTPNAAVSPQRKIRVQPPAEAVAFTIRRRPPVFPTPTPLSEQEKLLLSYYAHTPREEVFAQSHADEPPIAADDQTKIAVPDLIYVPQKSSNTR
jgi:hypothetical protein